MAVKHHFTFLTGLVLLAGLLIGIFTTKGMFYPQPVFNRENIVAVQSLPDVSFVDEKGRDVTLADFKGQVVLVNLWATWCPPCVGELASLDQLQAMLKDKGLTVLAVSMDRTPFAQVKEFLSQRDLINLVPYQDTGRQIATKWQYSGLPTSFLIGRDGKVIGRLDGPYEWHKGAVLEEIKKAL